MKSNFGLKWVKYPLSDRLNSLSLIAYWMFYKQHFYDERQAEIGKKSSKF